MYSISTKTAGEFSLPVFGLGTWKMGGERERDPNNDDTKDIKAIKKAIELGVTHIDTAEVYAAGHAEELVHEAIKDVPREKLFITTKVKGENLKPFDLKRSMKASLKRLGLDHVDLYLIHWSSLDVPLKKTMPAMDYLLEHELTKNIGVSNFDVPLVEEAASLTKYKIVNNQIHYNLSARDYETNGTIEYCQKNNILVTAYRPLDKGVFATGNNDILRRLADKYQKPPSQIAINWLLSKPNIVTLVKTSNIDHLQENLGALEWKLDDIDIDDLNKHFPRGETLHLP
ncbi:MAG: aldo/keto reductase [bacterium]